jgi:hypothetical protein
VQPPLDECVTPAADSCDAAADWLSLVTSTLADAVPMVANATVAAEAVNPTATRASIRCPGMPCLLGVATIDTAAAKSGRP